MPPAAPVTIACFMNDPLLTALKLHKIGVGFKDYIQYDSKMGYEAKTIAAVERLRADIVNGVHPPGQPLRIAALSARYGVSATPLREALSQLGEMHLVVAEPNCGWRVAPVSLADFMDLQGARLRLELALLEDAFAAPRTGWQADLRAAHDRLAQAVAPIGANDTQALRQAWLVAHDEFHMALVGGAGSLWLKRFYAQVLEQLRRHHQAVMSQRTYVKIILQTPLDQAFSVPRHGELMDAVLESDMGTATRCLHAHVAVAQDIFGQFLGDGLPSGSQGER